MNKKPLMKKEVIALLKMQNINNLESEKISILESENRILSRPIISKINLPPFTNSAVDGYAIRDDDLEKKNGLKVKYRIAAGDNNKITLLKGEVARIFTGAMMPKNSNTVVMQENVNDEKNMIKINKKPKKGENCRLVGEDIKKNNIVFESGQKITSIKIGLLAAIGKKFVSVNKKLKVGYFTSGNELYDPSEKLIGSKINNSNQYALHTLLNKNYLDVSYLGVLKDSKDKITSSLMKNIKDFSVIITTGGASVGDEDHLIDVIKEKGKLLFWKTAIKPGRPLAVGKIRNTFVICLPGNPVSVYLLYGMLIKTFLEQLCGSKNSNPFYYNATVNFSMRKKTERLEWLRVKIDNSEQK